MDGTSQTETHRTQESATLISDTLEQLVNEKATDQHELRHLCGASKSTVYRWLGGGDGMTADQLIRFNRLAASDRVRELLADELYGGTGWHAGRMPEAADLDGDGVVDLHDALKAAGDAVHESGRAINALADSLASLGKRDYSASRSAVAMLIQQAHTVQAILDWLQAQEDRRVKLSQRSGVCRG